MSKKLQDAEIALNDAVTNVARCAQEMSDNASQHSRGDEVYYKIPEEELSELRQALKEWKDATNNFLRATSEES